jgi:polysaccharide pyruvyl transferase WcaK-like protein
MAVESEESFDALKVFYKVKGVNDSLASDPATYVHLHQPADPLWLTSRGSVSFIEDGQAEQVQYPTQVCRRLAAMLQESTLLYPISRRHFDDFAVGLLQRVQA